MARAETPVSLPRACRGDSRRDGGSTLHSLRLMDLFQNLYCIQRTLGCLLVLEICKHVPPRSQVLTNAIHHGVALVGRIGGLAVPVIAEIGGHDIRRGALFGFGDAKRPVAASQYIEDLIRQPRRMAELECRGNRT